MPRGLGESTRSVLDGADGSDFRSIKVNKQHVTAVDTPGVHDGLGGPYMFAALHPLM